MLLAKSTWIEIKTYLEKSSTMVIPIGSNEQHGPKGLLGTDWMCPEIIANEAERQDDLLVAPLLNTGMAQQPPGFPGRIRLGPYTFKEVICDRSRSFALHGFDHMYFLNGH